MTGRYDRVAQTLHWLMALLILALWLMGENIDKVPRGPERTAFINLHVSFGVVFVALLAFRLFWRFSHTPPAQVPMPRWLSIVATAGHHSLYLLMVIIPVLGVAARLTHGRSIPIFNLFAIPSPFVENRALFAPLENIHGLFGTLLIILAAGHALMALYHHFMLRDGLLSRMSPFTR